MRRRARCAGTPPRRSRRRPREWSPGRPLPMSCSSAPRSRRSARARRATSPSKPSRFADRRALGDGLERVPVDGEPVVRVALRPRAHVLPLREQPHEHADVIERLEDRDRAAARREQRDERIARRRVSTPPTPRSPIRASASRSIGSRSSAARAASVEHASPRRRRHRARARPGRHGPRCRRRARGRPTSDRRDRCRCASSRDHRSDVIQTTARAASPSSRTSASASVASDAGAATASWSWSVSRSDRPPVTRCKRHPGVEEPVARLAETGAVLVAQVAERDERGDADGPAAAAGCGARATRIGAERPADPARRLDVAQAPGAVLEVGREHLRDRPGLLEARGGARRRARR